MATDFWSTIGSNAVTSRAEVQAAVGQVEQRLGALDLPDLVSFQDQLGQNLNALDLSSLAAIQIESAGGLMLEQTADHFLYARCACLLAGREKVREVLAESERFSEFVAPRLQSAEMLLYLARTEYQRRTGEPMR
ncbi:DUF4240 domain-containing protein [Actinoplanes sp. TBRC 11911]|uniref:DUF4240 domain-containing protein n=1 Tax=Actinoplanes sp. TBRC 11911 TaxID=2729386 RepID=UPI00145F29AB|nr:DUF4240 domain-containing protein [Actinoplanes sp. TBRC 11911]NMO51678.1 DUF4240 domain-containing protein [Actinoplanes sp. TBRC 11911]